ncbi:hypothetical protein ETB97_001946 [Aspergillus alliaceus]|uniref:Uncharacterized protein n=1 Tax=Petromyces alliaceus TaxID=209559 RepID=A0A8H6AFD0_PETAA|nr:hypothetical protein ETB97_001946 [Aspergillus burnettii]
MFLASLIFSILALPTTAVSQPLEERGSPAGLGSITVLNNMGYTVFMWSVDDQRAPMKTIPPGGEYRETYRLHPKGGGISIKLSTSPDITNIVQFEYTQAGEKIFWDVSCVNTKPGSPFYAKGVSLQTSSSDCPHAFTCAAGDSKCPHVYHKWNDDHASHGCPIHTSFRFQLGL